MEEMINTSAVKASDTIRDIYDYSDVLNAYNIKYTPESYYWQVNDIHIHAGWVLHLSVIRSQIPALLNLVIPDLMQGSIPFAVIRDYQIAGTLLDGGLGYANIGKTMIIYPANDKQALLCAKKLINLTKEFRGPVVPTDRHLGSIVYTNYEICARDADDKLPASRVPFNAYAGISWPYNEITTPYAPKPARLLNDIYYPLNTLKFDAKGDVKRGIYFKKLWNIRLCLIKQGRLNMFVDKADRDVSARLQWQYELYHHLGRDIPLPAIFDYFQHEGDTYLAMELIKGISLGKWINKAYQHRSWRDLSVKTKSHLLDKYLEILSIIGRLHDKGYIHRDITPENFMIDDDEKLFLIDMELTWCINSQKPMPPFELGTNGFMSPEQYNAKIPTIKEDIYGLGGLMLVFFTNLSPTKFEGVAYDTLSEHLNFFIGDEKISQLIVSCIDPAPKGRPGIDDIRYQLQRYQDKIRSGPQTQISLELSRTITGLSIKGIIQAGINGLSFPLLLTPKKRWISKAINVDKDKGNAQKNIDVYCGWHTGMAGPLWTVSLTQKAGFNIETCMVPFKSSWGYLQETLTQHPDTVPPGLYMGKAGIAIAISEGLSCGAMQADVDTLRLLHACLSSSAAQPDLGDGWAGQGIALLYCLQWIKDSKKEALLENCLNNILMSQRKDGSWDVRGASGKTSDILLGLDHGVAGIIWFLLSYLEKYHHPKTEIAVRNALDWLVRKSTVKKGAYHWNVSTKSRQFEKWSFEDGIPGIFLVLTKAYSVLKEPLYRKIVALYFKNIYPRTVLMDFSLRSGLAGIGHLCLDAFKTFGDPEYQDRADWIAALFVHSFQEIEQGAGYWLAHPTTLYTADLFSDNSGILHFMMRHQFPDKLNHPLNPFTKI